MLRLISGHVKNSTYPEHPLERKFLMQHMWRTRSSHKTQREVNAMNSRAKCVQTLLLLHSFMVAFWIELINPPPPTKPGTYSTIITVTYPQFKDIVWTANDDVEQGFPTH